MELFVFLCLNYFDVYIIVRKKQGEALLVLNVCIYANTSPGLTDLASLQQGAQHQCQSTSDTAVKRKMENLQVVIIIKEANQVNSNLGKPSVCFFMRAVLVCHSVTQSVGRWWMDYHNILCHS